MAPKEEFEPLVVGVSTRALFNLEEEHRIFEQHGVEAYATLQRDREQSLLHKGAAFEVIERLLALNRDQPHKLVEVIILSQNSPDLSLRAFNSVEHYGLPITKGSFTSGRCVGTLIPAWGIDLFLSNDETDVRSAAKSGAAAAKLGALAANAQSTPSDEVRIALDGDAVVFDAESERLYKESGLEAFLEHEKANAEVPLNQGPFGIFLRKLAGVRAKVSREDGTSRVRIAIVTARNAPAHARVVHTLRAWGTPADEAHFVGNHDKGPILAAIDAHIFFDDQERHVLSASQLVSAGLVLSDPANEVKIVGGGIGGAAG